MGDFVQATVDLLVQSAFVVAEVTVATIVLRKQLSKAHPSVIAVAGCYWLVLWAILGIVMMVQSRPAH